LIVQGLAWLGFMDERGSGIRRMRRALEQSGLPSPRFSLDHDCVTVEFQATSAVMSDRKQIQDIALFKDADAPATPEEAILQVIDKSGYATTSICVQKLGISRDTAWRMLTRMAEDGILEKTGDGRATRYRRKGKV
jgi:predicted HTH transcriptional regulator